MSACTTDDDRIWVSEVWESAMPMLTGEFTSQESQVVGGLGLAALR